MAQLKNYIRMLGILKVAIELNHVFVVQGSMDPNLRLQLSRTGFEFPLEKGAKMLLSKPTFWRAFAFSKVLLRTILIAYCCFVVCWQPTKQKANPP